jgi:hypothetical protein
MSSVPNSITQVDRCPLHSVAKMSFRFLTPFLGFALLGYLVLRTGPQIVWDQVHAVGFGLALIIVLGGASHSIKTWAWRRTFTCDISGLSWSRSFGAYLVSETLGQFGLAGKVIGEGMRVSLVGSAVPIANCISPGAIDGGLHMLTSAIVTVTGIIATLLLASLSGKLRFYALLFASALRSTGRRVELMLYTLLTGRSLYKRRLISVKQLSYTPSGKSARPQRDRENQSIWTGNALSWSKCHLDPNLKTRPITRLVMWYQKRESVLCEEFALAFLSLNHRPL